MPTRFAGAPVFRLTVRGCGAFGKFGHIIFGLILGILTVQHDIEYVFVLIGSLLPDLDHPKSTLGRWNPFVRWMRHRGHMHSLIGCMLLSAPAYLLGRQAFYYLLIGCVGHLVADKLHSLGRFKIKVW